MQLRFRLADVGAPARQGPKVDGSPIPITVGSAGSDVAVGNIASSVPGGWLAGHHVHLAVRLLGLVPVARLLAQFAVELGMGLIHSNLTGKPTTTAAGDNWPACA
jgi:hypothetical protein